MIFNVPIDIWFHCTKDIEKRIFSRSEKLKELAKKVAEVFQFLLSSKSKKRVGNITVIHTFERDFKIQSTDSCFSNRRCNRQ
jgi:hypothetical protein